MIPDSVVGWQGISFFLLSLTIISQAVILHYKNRSERLVRLVRDYLEVEKEDEED